jgi:hypothetical protein
MAVGYTGGDPNKVSVDGDTMTGVLVLDDGSPAASEEYVDDHGGGGAGTVTSVNNVTPNASGNVTLTATNVGAETSGTAVLKAVLTTKGDIFVHLDDGTITRLAVGSNNQVLTADSGRSAGVKWADAAAGTKAPATLTDGATIATDASLSNQFRVTLAGSRTLSNPTNGADGQVVTWSIKQDGTGSRTLTLDTKFRFGSDLTSVTLSTAAGKTDKLGAQYNSGDDKWDIVAFVRGF